MHPEVVLSPDAAYNLFQTLNAAIIAMADRLPIKDKHEETQA